MVGVGVEGSEKEVRQLGGMPGIRMNLDPACSFLHSVLVLWCCMQIQTWFHASLSQGGMKPRFEFRPTC